MKRHFIILSILVCTGMLTRAQLSVNNTPATSEEKVQHNLGTSIIEFTKAIRPGTFTNSFAKQKSNFISSASKITEPASLGKSLSALAGFIKPSKFKPEFNIAAFVKATAQTTSMEGAKGFMKDLENNLQPEALTDIWTIQRNGWLSGLNSIK